MAGKFEIHPTDGTTIACDTSDSIDTSEYLLMSQDLKEDQREKIIYSEGRFDGSVINSTASIVTVEFEILVNGNTPEEIAINVATMKAAFFNRSGGYIEYRPVGYSNSVMSTFYKYLQSAPPQRLRGGDTIQSSIETLFTMGELYRFQVKIFSLAISDPDSLHRVVNTTIATFSGYGVGTPYAQLPSSSIKGDGMICVLRCSNSTDVQSMIVHVSETPSAGLGKDLLSVGTIYSPFTFSNDNRFYLSSAASGILTFEVPTESRKLFGRCVPIINARIVSGEWECRITWGDPNLSAELPIVDWFDLNPGVAYTSHYGLNILDTINLPPVPVASTLDIATAFNNASTIFGLEVRTKDSASHSMYIYGLLMLNIENGWIAKFDPSEGTVGMAGYVNIHALDGIFYTTVGVNDAVLGYTPEKIGMSAKDLIISKGDYQIRALCRNDGITRKGWHHDTTTVSIVMDGVFYTIYPFGEA
jgi:hypothetical protein